MLIGIDGNEANVSQKVGVGQYAFELLWHLYKLDKTNNYLIYLKDQPSKELPPENKNWQYRVFGPSRMWTRFALPFHLFTQKEKLNLFYSPSHYSPAFSPCPTIPTIHDIGYLQFQNQFTKKDLYQLINWTKESIRKAAHIITVSNFSKDEIIKTYGIDPQKISIAYNGVDNPPKINIKKQKEILSSYNLQPSNYYLYLGTLKPNKNIPFLIKSFAQLIPRLVKEGDRGRLKLVIAGKKGWLFNEIFEAVKKENLESNIIFTDFLDNQQKWTLYQNAIATVLPSTYEGFGIPAIESMKVNTPVIVSNIPPFKEVVGDCGLIIDPANTDDLCQKMLEINNPKLRQKYARSGKSQADKFTWDSTAKSVLQVFQKFSK